jgi:nucleoside-diphosphate-sugar epimerase
LTSIAVIGANGQVGSEVALLLSRIQGVSVVPIVRSQLGAAVLERCGLACRIGSLTSDADAKRLLDGCSLVADFSLPTGLPGQVSQAMRANAWHAIRNAPARAPYVFISSTMAFGGGNSGRYERLWFARTPYAAAKRSGERCARWLGRLQGRPTYVLRLGQVFGELQAVSRGLLASATDRPLALLDGAAGQSPSDAVFCSTIALALANIAAGKEAPGTYTLLEAPEWTWQRLYAFHAKQAGLVPQFVESAAGSRDSGALRSRLEPLLQRAVGAAAQHLVAHKDLLVAQLVPIHSGLAQHLKARHLLRRARAEIRPPARRAIVEVQCCRGPVPGRRLGSLSDSQQDMQMEVLGVRTLLQRRLGPSSHNYR